MKLLIVAKQAVAWVLAEVAVALTGVCDFVHVAEVVSLIPLRLGNQVRYQFYLKTLEQCGSNVTVNFGTIISDRKTRVGSNIWLGTYNVVGLVEIKDFTLTGPGCAILSGRLGHSFKETDVPIMHQPYIPTRCSLGPDVWLGANVIVMANLGRGCVIGAGAVVVEDIPDWAVAVGNPARVVRSRKQSVVAEHE